MKTLKVIVIGSLMLVTASIVYVREIFEAFHAQDKDIAINEKLKDSARNYLATYFGGSGEEACWTIALDDEENVYVSGYTRSNDFPVTQGSYNGAPKGKADVFIIKFDKDLKTVLAATRIGGDEDELAHSIIYDKKGYIYVAGKTSSKNFPVTSSAYSRKYNGGTGDAYIFKMDKDLKRLEASTFLGGSGNENSWMCGVIDMDQNGNIVMAGNTASENFPTTKGAFSEKFNGGNRDGFISILDGGLSKLLYSTYIGGNGGEDILRGLCIDKNSGEICVAGITFSTNFPVSNPVAGQTSLPSGGFIAKFSPDLSRINSSAALKGAVIMCMLIHENGDVYVGGHASKDFPITSKAFYRTFDMHDDQGFISRLSNDLAQLKSSTLLPGSFPMGGGGIACLALSQNSEGDIVSSGWALPLNFPATPGAFDETYNADNDNYILIMDKELSKLKASTFVGGKKNDHWNRLAMSKNGDIYVGGYTYSEDYPTTAGSAFVNYNGGETDGFLVRINGNLSAEWGPEFHDAAKRNNLKKVKRLLAGNRDLLGKKDKYGRTALHSAARYGALKVCRYLLEKGAEVNAKDESGNTPLHLASLHRHDDVAVLLADSKADINALNNDSASPLSLAIIYGTPKTTQFLLSQNADRRIEDKDGNTILHLASYYGYSEKAKEILKYQPEIDKRNKAGFTPLHLSIQWADNAELIKDLFDHGANPDLADNDGKNSLHMVWSFIFTADKIKAILEKKFDINALDKDGNTPLHHAMSRVSRSGSLTPYRKGIEILMNRGANPNIKNKEGKSAMDLAVESGMQDAVELLKAKK